MIRTSRYDAAVVLQMGGPRDSAEIEPFLRNLFSDPDIIQLPRLMRRFQPQLAARIAKKRAPAVRPRYESIGGSPIGAITHAQAAGLSQRLGIPVQVAMRYCSPSADDAVTELQRLGAHRILILPLYPHYSHSTTGSSLRDMARAIEASGIQAEWSVIERWGDHPAYIDALAATCQDATGHLVLSAHSLPERYVEAGDPYPDEVEATVRLLEGRVEADIDSIVYGYQSAVGPVKWIGPTTDERIREMASSDVPTISLAPLGFVSDHIETLYDIDQIYTDQVREQGKQVHRVPSLNERSDFLDALATICQGPATPFEAVTWTT